MNKTKTHTLIVRGVPRSQKNALKRMANTFTPRKVSVNSLMLMMIENQTKPEVIAYELKSKQS